MGALVLPDTKQKINRLAFAWLVTVGDVLDRLVMRYKEKQTKNENDISTRKIGPKAPPRPVPMSPQARWKTGA
jgi:hypothetical protein